MQTLSKFWQHYKEMWPFAVAILGLIAVFVALCWEAGRLEADTKKWRQR